MKIAILGSGGREHALALKILESNKTEKIYCIPGNAGTSNIGENIELDLKNFEEIKKFVKSSKIDLVIVGPEQPLVDGIVNYLENHDIRTFGPDEISSQLEGSKIFTKKICEKYKIPTAKFGIFNNITDSILFIEKASFPLVVKADGLAAGKGVYICEKKDDAINATNEIFGGKFGKAENILFEEFLIGEEMSFFVISDGNTFKTFQTAQDHKRVLEGDKGKNTGGMGAYSPSKLINKELEEKIIKKIIEPTLSGLKELGSKYRGFLYAGLMIVNNEPYLIEYNVRMGDPECQTILPRLKTDFLEILISCCEKNLNNIELEWHQEKSLCIVLCSKGYPDKYEKNSLIKNLSKIEDTKTFFVFHAGTKKIENKIYSNGGRVLNFVSLSNNFKECRDKSIQNIENLNWENGFFRSDIGHRVIK